MMLYGCDLIYHSKATAEQSLEYAKRIIALIWPACIFENDDNEHGFFAYMDEKSKQSWDADGATPQNNDFMINVLASKNQITFVVGSHNDTTARLENMIFNFRNPLYDKVFSTKV